MKMQRALVLGVALTSLSTTGCGTVFDIAYLAGSKRYDETAEERKPTGEVNTEVEYDSTIGPDGRIQFLCEERERRIERTFTVSKTYEYRGSYKPSTYVAATALSAVAAGAIAGIVALGCTLPPQPGETNPKRWSCLNMVYATPFVADVGWSLIRVFTAKPPKLVDKKKYEGQVALAAVPSKSSAVSCDSIDRVAFGQAYFANEDRPADGQVIGSLPMKLVDGAIPVAIENGSTTLVSQPEIVHAWMQNFTWGLWVINREDQAKALKIDRCGALRPAYSIMTPQEQMSFNAQCPITPPQANPPR